jgi:hypothetical protein
MKPCDFYSAPQSQGFYGNKPISYIKELPGYPQEYGDYIMQIPNCGNRSLNRTEVRAISRNRSIHPLSVYACIMAWGKRNKYNYRLSIKDENADRVASLIKYLRTSSRSIGEDFAHVQSASNKITGLGISFYTKLLFFVRKEPNAYILDQWTAKSSTLLFPELGIKIKSQMPDPETSHDIYEAFCKRLDQCAEKREWGVNWNTGEEVELTLFDKPNGCWRNYLKNNWRPTPKKRRNE